MTLIIRSQSLLVSKVERWSGHYYSPGFDTVILISKKSFVLSLFIHLFIYLFYLFIFLVKISAKEVCGCPLVTNVFEETGDFCRASKRTCLKHYCWEKLRRAEIDLQRIQQVSVCLSVCPSIEVTTTFSHLPHLLSLINFIGLMFILFYGLV